MPWNYSKFLPFLLSLIGLQGVYGEAAAIPPWVEGAANRLRAGEVVVGNQPLEEGHTGNVWAAVWIPATREHIWQVMVDCAEAPEFVPGLKTCEVLQSGLNEDLRRHRVDYSFLFPDVVYEFRTSYSPPVEMRFRRTGGDLKEMEGLWRLAADPAGEGTFVLYSVYLEPGFWVPKWMVRRLMKGNLPEVLLSLRDRVVFVASRKP